MMLRAVLVCHTAGWDRQPYIYRLNESRTDGTGELRISPQTQTIANNLIYTVNFNGQACGSIGELYISMDLTM